MTDTLSAIFPSLDFELLFDSAPHPYLLLSPTFIVLYANQMYLRLMRMSHEALLNRNLLSVFKEAPEAWRNAISESLGRVGQSRSPDTIHTAYVTGTNRRLWKYCHSPILNESGGIRYIIQSIDHKPEENNHLGQAGEAEFSQKRFETMNAELDALIQSMPEAVYIGDEAGIWRCNNIAVQMLGFENADDLKVNVAVLADRIQARYVDSGERIPPEDEAFSHALRGERFERDLSVRNVKTGQDMTVRSAAAPIYLNGKIIGAVAINTNMSERQALLASEKAARTEAEQAVKDRDAFLSIAAHELKTPLTSLRGFAQLLLRQLKKHGTIDVEKSTTALKTLDIQSVKLTRLLDQLLDVAKLEKDRLSIERHTTDLVSITKEAIQTVHQSRGGQSVVMSAPESMIIEADAIRLEQVLINLLDNAMKYGKAKDPVRVELHQIELQIAQIVVADRGIGIPLERRDRLFERTYQAHGKANLDGMGLGLYVSKQIVELHGGTIKAEFPAEGGTRFVISLPLDDTPP